MSETVTLHNDHLRLEIHPAAGASIVALEVRHEASLLPVLRPTPLEAVASGNSSLMSCFVLAPFSNRLRDARFRFRGRTYQLRANTAEGYAIHGDVRKRPWKEGARSAERISFAIDSRDFADANFPFPYRVELEYALEGATLAATACLTSAADQAMPAGLGFHPYYRRTLLDPAEQVEIAARVSGAYPELVPTEGPRPLEPGEDFSGGRPLGDASFDTCFAGWDGRATVTWPGSRIRARIEADPVLEHLILFAPPGKTFFALEPVSNANNGFNLAALGVPDAGVRVLAPEESLRGGFRIAIEKL